MLVRSSLFFFNIVTLDTEEMCESTVTWQHCHTHSKQSRLDSEGERNMKTTKYDRPATGFLRVCSGHNCGQKLRRSVLVLCGVHVS